MQNEAAEAGFYKSPAGGQYPKVQILTVRDLLEKKKRVGYRRLLDKTLKNRRAIVHP